MIGMALMNVIPVVASIFGAAYAVQPAYGIGFERHLPLIPVLGNILRLVIPFVGNLSGRSAAGSIIVGALGSGCRVRLPTPSASIAYTGDHHVAAHVGVVYQALNAFSRAFTRTFFRPAPEFRRWPFRRMSAQRSRPCSRRFSQQWRRPARPTSLSQSARLPLLLRLSRRLRPGAPGRPIESISRISVNRAPFRSTKAITTACERQAWKARRWPGHEIALVDDMLMMTSVYLNLLNGPWP